MRRSRYIFIFVFLLLGLCANAKKPVKKEIVFLTPYEAKTQIIQQYIESAQNEFADTSRYRLHFYAVYEYIGNYFTKNEYARDLSHLLERIMGFVRKDGYKPDLFIINQDFLSQAVAKSDDPLLKSTPILCIDLMHPEWNGLLKNSPNITVIENEPAVKENIDFITDLGFSNYIVTVMDSTYIDDHLREHILSQLSSDTLHYRPNLHLEQVDRIQSPHKRDKRTTLFPISIMNPEKNNRHPDVPGGFDLEWIFYTRQQGTSFLHIKNDAYSNAAMHNNIGPYFAQTPEYFNLPLINPLNSCLGGYMTPFPQMMEQIHPVVDRILDGTKPSDIPWGKLKKAYWLDWRLARRYHKYANQFPKGINFVNLPFKERSPFCDRLVSLWIPGLVILLFLFGIIVSTHFRKKQKLQHDQLLKKGQEADKFKAKVDYILSGLNSYIFKAVADNTIVFSKSFYEDFSFAHKSAPLEDVLRFVLEPGRSQLRDIIISGPKKEKDVDIEVLVELPDSPKPHAILIHLVSYNDYAGTPLFAGLFYFNDEAYKRNEELRQAYRLDEEVAEKESFLSQMTSKFRVPLERIIGVSKLLVNHFHDLSDEEKITCNEQIISSNDELMEMLKEVFDNVRHESADNLLGNCQSLSSLMEDCYTSFSASLSNMSRLSLENGPDDCEILIQRPAFFQMMTRILTDALKDNDRQITIGWRKHINGKENIIFIDNAQLDTAKLSEMVESISGRIYAIHNFKGHPRIEISFVAPPLRSRVIS